MATKELMARRSDASLATLLLVSRLGTPQARPLTSNEFWRLVDSGVAPESLLGLSQRELPNVIGVALAERAAPLLERATAFAFELEQLESSGIRTLSPYDDDYPARWRAVLGSAAPAVVHCAGPPALLQRGGLAIVGARDLGPEGAEVAKQAAADAARAGRVVISGGARGTDRLAMNAARDAGGEVVGVLAESLERTARDADVRRAINDEQLCLATPFIPTAPFSAGNAMARNKLIYALADLTFVVASDLDKGGTWAGATEALTKNYGRVAVWEGPGAGEGNAALVGRGAEAAKALADLSGGSTTRLEDPHGAQLRFGV